MTDSSADLTPGDAQALGVKVVPMLTYVGNRAQPLCADDAPEAFWRYVAASGGDGPVRTAQPTPGDFCRTYRSIGQDGFTGCIISIHPSELLSGTVQSARLAAGRTEGADVVVVDSQMVGPPVGHMVREAGLAGEDHTGEEIADFLSALLSRVQVCVYASALGELTGLQPEGWWNRLVRGMRRPLRPNIFRLIDGEFRPVGRARNSQEAIEHLSAFAAEGKPDAGRVNFVGAMSAGAGAGSSLSDQLCSEVPTPVEVEEFTMGPVLGAHLGRESLGVFTVAG